VHLIIEWFAGRVFDLFKIAIANTTSSQQARPAVQRATAVYPHLVSDIMGVLDVFKGQLDASLTLVIITAGKVAEANSKELVLPK
jgi:hypothetical protein